MLQKLSWRKKAVKNGIFEINMNIWDKDQDHINNLCIPLPSSDSIQNLIKYGQY